MRQVLTIAEVRLWTGVVLDALERQGKSVIDIEHDQHWDVFFEDAFDLTREPTVLVGSLADDIDDLRREMLASKYQDRGMVVSHVCHHLVGIMKFLAFSAGGAVINTYDLGPEAPPHA